MISKGYIPKDKKESNNVLYTITQNKIDYIFMNQINKILVLKKYIDI